MSTPEPPLSFLSTPHQAHTGSRTLFAYKALLQAIRKRYLKPGDRIREEEIAHVLGISRTPVREALQHLLVRRLVEVIPGHGITVSELSKQQIQELYAMREVLEGTAARFAAQFALDDEIAMMGKLAGDFEIATVAEQLSEINTAFHRSIHEASRNRYFQEALGNLHDSFSLLPSVTYSFPERRARSVEEHKAIVTAIANRDPDAAEAASRAHIREAQRMRLQTLRLGEPL